MAKKTFTTVETATELAAEINKMQFHTNLSKETLHERVYNWYCHSDVTDIVILASCAMCCDYFNGATYDDMLMFTDIGFPSEPETSIWEIEAAEKDTKWH